MKSIDKVVATTKLRSDCMKGSLTALNLLPMKRLVLIASDIGAAKLLAWFCCFFFSKDEFSPYSIILRLPLSQRICHRWPKLGHLCSASVAVWIYQTLCLIFTSFLCEHRLCSPCSHEICCNLWKYLWWFLCRSCSVQRSLKCCNACTLFCIADLITLPKKYILYLKQWRWTWKELMLGLIEKVARVVSWLWFKVFSENNNRILINSEIVQTIVNWWGRTILFKPIAETSNKVVFYNYKE